MHIGPGEFEDFRFEVIGHHVHPRARAQPNELEAVANPIVFDSHEYGRVARPEKSTSALDASDSKSGAGDIAKEWIGVISLHDRHDELHCIDTVVSNGL